MNRAMYLENTGIPDFNVITINVLGNHRKTFAAKYAL
jgi:hypothetical protein